MKPVCPVCGAALIRTDGSFRCRRSHTFDVAGEGYVNLLVRPKRKILGDAKEMLRARRRFLSAGHYDRLSGALNDAVYRDLSAAAPAREDDPADAILDSGCGEGFYVGRLKQHLDRRLPRPASYAGLDVAKDAARLAATRYKGILFVVADVTTKIPFADGSIRVLVDVFAPRNGAEFARILAPGALLLVVVPTAGHLIELRTALDLLGIEEDKPTRIADRLAGAFTLRSTEALEYPMTLRRDDAANLVGMTPNYWHGAAERLPLARCSLPQQVTASFDLLSFARTRAG